MPTPSTILKVFVASPSDVAEERHALEQAVAEVDQIRSGVSGVRLELVRWETHARPGFGTDAQDVINSQIPDDFDIFLGLMWIRFGSPTNRAGSGTHEEFRHALQCLRSNPNTVSLMLYFKEAMVEFDMIDPEQFKEVQAFKASLKQQGALYWTFRSPEEFQDLLRVHLQAEITEWEKRIASSGTAQRSEPIAAATVGPEAIPIDEDQEGLGFLDCLEISDERFTEATAALERIAKALEFMSARLPDRAAQMTALSSAEDPDVRAARRIARRTAEDMNQFTSIAVVDTPLMANAIPRTDENGTTLERCFRPRAARQV